MPELPEVETVMRGMRTRLNGHTIAEVLVRRDALRWPIPPHFASALRGKRIETLIRRGKYILMRTSGGLTVLWHLGMSGRVHLENAEDESDRDAMKHEHIVVRTREGTRLGLVDPRRFGAVDLFPTQDERTHKLLSGMGIEPLGPDFSEKTLAALLTGRKTPIKAALLDQRLIAGLGNIYVCEALYRAHIHPEQHAGLLTPAEIGALAASIPPVLNEAIAAGGSSLRDYKQTDGSLGYFQTAWQVYGREGEPCPQCPGKPACSGVVRIVQSGRSSFLCPKHQILTQDLTKSRARRSLA